MRIDEATFSSGEVCKAAGIKNGILQTWISRGLIVGHNRGYGVPAVIDMPGKAGVRRQFTYHNLMEVAAVAELVAMGVDLRVACKAAREFSHSGDRVRQVGFPFLNGRTLVCFTLNQVIEVMWDQSGKGEDVMTTIRRQLGRPGGFMVLDASALFDRVVSSLGYHPEAVLEEAYSNMVAKLPGRAS